MLSRRWLSAIAIGGWLSISLLLTVLAANGYGVARGNDGKGYRDASRDQDTAYDHVDHARARVAVGDSYMGTIGKHTPCNSPQGNINKDLCQQWRMAEFAGQLVDLTYTQVIIGVFTCIGLVITIIYASKGTKAAWDSVALSRESANSAAKSLIEAKKATKAAEDSVVAARSVGQAQVRAYISCTDSEFGISEKRFKVEIILKNTGQSPASDITIDGILELGLKNDDKNINHIKTNVPSIYGHCQAISSGATQTGIIIWDPLEYSKEIEGALSVPELFIRIDCKLTYKDVFDIKNDVEIILTTYEKKAPRGKIVRLLPFNRS